jgi:hypothetical protein
MPAVEQAKRLFIAGRLKSVNERPIVDVMQRRTRPVSPMH